MSCVTVTPVCVWVLITVVTCSHPAHFPLAHPTIDDRFHPLLKRYADTLKTPNLKRYWVRGNAGVRPGQGLVLGVTVVEAVSQCFACGLCSTPEMPCGFAGHRHLRASQ